MLIALQALLVLGVVAGVVGIAWGLRWRPRLTRDVVIYLFSIAVLGRGVVEGRPDLLYAGIAMWTIPPTVRLTTDKAKDISRRGEAS